MWKAEGLTGMSNGKWIVGKYKVMDVWVYKLWHDKDYLGKFSSFDECKDRVKELEAESSLSKTT